MKNEKAVHIVCILDKSGSMSRLQKSVIDNFNNFLSDQKEEKGKAYLTLVLFDNLCHVVHNKVNIKDVSPLQEKDYLPGGNTALYDAIGSSIHSCQDKNTLMLIQTDGAENASQKFNKNSITQLISEKEKMGWDFLFMGANIDTGAEGSKMGLRNKSVSFAANDIGIADSFMGMGEKTKHYRYMKEQDDNYCPPTNEELNPKSQEKPKVRWDNEQNKFVLI